MKRKFLLAGTIIIIIVGVVFASSPFILSWEPSAKAKAERSQHDISKLERGHFLIEPFDRGSAWDELVLIIKDWDGEIYSYLMPTKDGKVIMPDRWWGWGYDYCENFGPDLGEANAIERSGYIRCHDADVPEWRETVWVWSYSGTAQSSWMDDMYSPGHEINGNYLYINR